MDNGIQEVNDNENFNYVIRNLNVKGSNTVSLSLAHSNTAIM